MIKIGSIKFINTCQLAEDLSAHISNGKASFALPFQRGYVWDQAKKSAFILNLIEGGPTFPIYVNKVDGIDYIIDGQQRGKTTNNFIGNKFALSKLPPIQTSQGEIIDISGKKFKDFSQELQNTILRYNFGYCFGENLTDEQVRVVFVRLNSGKPLSATEMTKAQIKSINEVKALAKHEVFNKIIGEKGIEASKNDDLVMQIYVILFEKKIDLLASQIRKVLSAKLISAEELSVISKCLDCLGAVYHKLNNDSSYEASRTLKVLRKKSHLVAFVYVINQSLLEGIYSPELLSDWVKYFFNGDIDKTSISEEYNALLLGGMNQRESVDARLKAMYDSFLEYQLTQE